MKNTGAVKKNGIQRSRNNGTGCYGCDVCF